MPGDDHPEKPDGDERDDRPEAPGRDLFERIRVELEPERLDDTLRELGERIKKLVRSGRYTRVRLSYKGKPILKDVPMGVFLAGELASLWWMGPLRAAVVHLGLGAVLEVELVHRADDRVREGLDHFLRGEVDDAEDAYREALRMNPDNVTAWYNLGVLLRVTGRREEAVAALRKAASSPEHPDGRKAADALARMGGGRKL